MIRRHDWGNRKTETIDKKLFLWIELFMLGGDAVCVGPHIQCRRMRESHSLHRGQVRTMRSDSGGKAKDIKKGQF